MNKNELLSIMAKNGDNQEDLAQAMGISRCSLNKKINENNSAYFSQLEILAMKERYQLTSKQIDVIFFTPNVS